MHRLLLAVWFCSRLLPAAPQDNSQTLAQKAVDAERRGDFAAAVSAFHRLIHNGADSPELRSNLGIAYYQLHNFSSALQQLKVTLATSPDSLPANLFAGLSLLNLQRPKESLPYLQKAHVAQPGDTTTLLALARAEIECNHLPRSRDFYQQALRLDPRNAEAWYGVGITDRVLAERELKRSTTSAHAGNTPQATKKSQAMLDASEQAIGKAMELDPGSVRARMILGESFRIAERYDLAVQELKAATGQQPNLAPAWAGLAAAYSASGDDRNALQAGSRALELEPNDAETNALIAGTYLRLSDDAKAETCALRALRLKPDLSSAHVVLAKIYLSRQQPRKALPELQRAVEDDTDGATYYLLATTLRQLGRQSDAVNAMRKYKQLHSAHVATMSGAH
jgi:tetratricopeptide (TPR) repeat protein